MQRFELTRDADKDLENIYHYGIDNFGIEQAITFYYSLNEAFDSICSNPQHYPSVDDVKNGYRRAVFKTYSIFFVERDDYIEISRVLRKDDITLAMK